MLFGVHCFPESLYMTFEINSRDCESDRAGRGLSKTKAPLTSRANKGNSGGGGDSNPVSQTEGLRSCRLDDLPFPYSRRNPITFKGLGSMWIKELAVL
jgi:hypothetical protein